MNLAMTEGAPGLGDGMAVSLAHAESGSGDPLVLIMGLGADRSAWEPHLRAYEQRFRCLSVDNRGVGGSPAPSGPYSTARMADDYACLIRRLRLGPVRVVGISMGGAIAQELALRHPDLVERLVLVSTWAVCDPYTREVFDHFAAVRPAVDPVVWAALLQLWIWTPQSFAAHQEQLVAERRSEAAVRQSDEAFGAQCAACTGHDTLNRLGEIEAPTLITGGVQDIFTPPALAQQLHAGIRGSRLEVLPGGHAHHWEHLEQFNRLTMEWLT